MEVITEHISHNPLCMCKEEVSGTPFNSFEHVGTRLALVQKHLHARQQM